MLVFLALRLCIGHYSPPGGCDKLLEANNSLPMKVQVGHQCQFMPRDGILTKSSQPCEIWLFFWPLRLCIGLYRPSEAAGGLKMVVKAVHKFNFCSGDKIQSKSALWCKIWSCFRLCGTLEAAICYWRPPTASQ